MGPAFDQHAGTLQDVLAQIVDRSPAHEHRRLRRPRRAPRAPTRGPAVGQVHDGDVTDPTVDATGDVERYWVLWFAPGTDPDRPSPGNAPPPSTSWSSPPLAPARAAPCGPSTPPRPPSTGSTSSPTSSTSPSAGPTVPATPAREDATSTRLAGSSPCKFTPLWSGVPRPRRVHDPPTSPRRTAHAREPRERPAQGDRPESRHPRGRPARRRLPEDRAAAAARRHAGRYRLPADSAPTEPRTAKAATRRRIRPMPRCCPTLPKLVWAPTLAVPSTPVLAELAGGSVLELSCLAPRTTSSSARPARTPSTTPPSAPRATTRPLAASPTARLRSSSAGPRLGRTPPGRRSRRPGSPVPRHADREATIPFVAFDEVQAYEAITGRP